MLKRIAFLALTVIVIFQGVRYLVTISDPAAHLQASVDACICLMVFIHWSKETKNAGS